MPGHLLDGGVTDNLGLRGPFEDIMVKGGIRNKVGGDLDPGLVSKLAIVVVNAAFRGERGWDHYRKPPNIVQVTLALGTVPMNQCLAKGPLCVVLEVIEALLRDLASDSRQPEGVAKASVR